MLGRHVLRPIDCLHGRVEIVRRFNIGFEDRLQDAHCRAQPKICFVEGRLLAGESHASPARRYVAGPDLVKLIRKNCFEAAGAGGEEANHDELAALDPTVGF
jgi:hypothetical protein